jgi:long-chain fatty acid transport protein
MKKTVFFTSMMAMMCCTSLALASGYRIPEQSLNGTALSNAYLANANQADAAYYNPANMSWLDQGTVFEAGFTYIHLPEINYEDFRTPAYDGTSERENFLIPNLYVVSPDINNFRFGFAVVAPAGLSKKWEDPFPRTFAEEFTMTVVEANPTVSYKFSDMFSVAGGVRFIYGDATVKSQGTIMVAPSEYVMLSREMDGDTFEYGYNLALTVKPVNNLTVAATYRSKVDLDLEGDAKLNSSQSFTSGIIPAGAYNGEGAVSVPLPAIFAFGVAYTFDKSTIEFEYDRTFWSDYETLNFQYPSPIYHPVLNSAFSTPIAKDWDDVDAFRLGYTFQWDQQLSLMAGIGIDGNPVPDSNISFDLPDSDAWFVSCGFRYKMNEKLSLGAAYLYASKEDRTVQTSTLNGEFSGASSHLLAMSVSYLF